jgi:uncharacterized protein YfaS (alpha-2-macroglobulin family)
MGNSIVEEVYEFEVEEYVLPKFEVKILAENFIVEKEDSDFALKVDALYTFGKPVRGELTISVAKQACEVPPWANIPQFLCEPFTECPATYDNGCRIGNGKIFGRKQFQLL